MEKRKGKESIFFAEKKFFRRGDGSLKLFFSPSPEKRKNEFSTQKEWPVGSQSFAVGNLDDALSVSLWR